MSQEGSRCFATAPFLCI